MTDPNGDAETAYVMNDIFMTCCQNKKFIVREYLKKAIIPFIYILADAMVYGQCIRNMFIYAKKFDIPADTMFVGAKKIQKILAGTKYEFEYKKYGTKYRSVVFTKEREYMRLHNNV